MKRSHHVCFGTYWTRHSRRCFEWKNGHDAGVTPFQLMTLADTERTVVTLRFDHRNREAGFSRRTEQDHVTSLARTVAVAVVMVSFDCSAILAAEPNATASPTAITSATTPSPDFESLRIKGLNIALPGPEDTIDPDFAGIRSSLASVGIGYIGWSNNNFYNNLLPHEQSTFGQQTYNGQKPTFFACTPIGMLPWPVRKMIGMSVPAFANSL